MTLIDLISYLAVFGSMLVAMYLLMLVFTMVVCAGSAMVICLLPSSLIENPRAERIIYCCTDLFYIGLAVVMMVVVIHL